MQTPDQVASWLGFKPWTLVLPSATLLSIVLCKKLKARGKKKKCIKVHIKSKEGNHIAILPSANYYRYKHTHMASLQMPGLNGL